MIDISTGEDNTQYEERKISCSELNDYIWALRNSLETIRKSLDTLRAEEYRTLELLMDAENEACIRNCKRNCKLGRQCSR
jgi:hypothetical protein